MDQWIITMLNNIGTGVDDETLNNLFKTPESYSKIVYDITQNIAHTAVLPIATVILTIVTLLELQKAARRADGDRQTGVRLIAAVLFRTAILFVLAANTGTILNGLLYLTQQVLNSAHDVAQVADPSATQPLGDKMSSAIKDAGIFGQMPMLIMLLLPFLVSKAAVITAQVVILLRFVNLYALTAFHPFPLMFIAHDETKQWAINYFRQFLIVAFQAVTIYVSLLIYRAFAPTLTSTLEYTANQSLPAWVFSNFQNLLLASVLLMTVVVTANGIAKKLFGGE